MKPTTLQQLRFRNAVQSELGREVIGRDEELFIVQAFESDWSIRETAAALASSRKGVA